MPRRQSATVQLKVRMKEPLRAKIASAAKKHGVSLNAEAVDRLAQSFEKGHANERVADTVMESVYDAFEGEDTYRLMTLLAALKGVILSSTSIFPQPLLLPVIPACSVDCPGQSRKVISTSSPAIVHSGVSSAEKSDFTRIVFSLQHSQGIPIFGMNPHSSLSGSSIEQQAGWTGSSMSHSGLLQVLQERQARSN